MRGRLHRAGRSLQTVQRVADGRFEFDDPGLHARGAFGLGGAVLVLIGRERAGLDHALAKHLQRVGHRRDLVALVAVIDFRFEVAAGQQLHRALQAADPPQDVAADIEPDEQDRSDQRQHAEREHHLGGESNLLARLPGRCVGFLLHAVDQLLHADAEADIELAGFFQNGLAVIGGVEFLLADLEDAGLALAQRQQFQRGLLERLGAGILRQLFEVRFDARLGLLEFLLDGLERVAVIGRQRRRHVGGHQIGAGDHVAELFDRARGLGCVVGGKIGRSQDRVDLALGVHHRRARGGDEVGLRLAQRVILLLVQGRDVEPLACGRAQALDHVIDVLHGLGESGDDGLVGPQFDDLAELLQRERLGRPATLRCARRAPPVPGWQGWRSAPTIAGWRRDGECRARSDRPWCRRAVQTRSRRRR